MALSETTRRDILDFLIVMRPPFHGRLSLATFLGRVWDLSRLPASDQKFPNAELEFRERKMEPHSYSELLYERFDLLKCSDSVFLNFLVQCVHPVVLRDEERSAELTAFFNAHLEREGYRLVESSKTPGMVKYRPERIKKRPQPSQTQQAGVTDQLAKCVSCGYSARTAAKFCPNCGERLTSNENVTAVFDNENRPSAGTTGDPFVGRIIQAKYEIRARIGIGGMGRVYRARRLQIGDEVVIKLLDNRYLFDDVAAERFRREAQAAARIRHKNVVVIHDFSNADADTTPAFIVMEFVDGISLKNLLTNEGPLSQQRTVDLMTEICQGVGAGHNLGVIHRDIKPDNIIVATGDEKQETVKVIDFGLAKLRDEINEQGITQVGAILGTPSYMSPEQCRGDALSTESDVYSLGVLTYEMLAGKLPFSGSNAAAICAKHQYEEPPPLSSLGSKAIEAVVMRALAKDPSQRQRTATEYSSELRSAAGANFATDQKTEQAVDDPEIDRPTTPATAAFPAANTLEYSVLRSMWEESLERARVATVRLDDVVSEISGSDQGPEVSRVLNLLLTKGYVKVSGAFEAEVADSDSYTLTSLGFEQCANTFVENYSSLKQSIAVIIANGGAMDNLSLSEITHAPRLLIDHVLDLMSHKSLVRLVPRLGRKVVISEVSNDLISAHV